MLTLLASIGFVLAIISFIGGFRMIRRTDHPGEDKMHRINGYITISLYLALAVISLGTDFAVGTFFLWCLGLLVHLMKVLIARKGLAVRYGGYMGALLITTWLIVIFTHLPS